MSDAPIPPKAVRAPKSHAQAKAERLQAALRDNLRRRKAANTAEVPGVPGHHEKASQKDTQNPTE